MFINNRIYYEVRAKPKENIHELRYTFWKIITYSLENAKLDNDGNAIWIQAHCSSQLAMECGAVLDWYFKNIEIQVIESEQEGWNQIRHKQSFWYRVRFSNSSA